MQILIFVVVVVFDTKEQEFLFFFFFFFKNSPFLRTKLSIGIPYFLNKNMREMLLISGIAHAVHNESGLPIWN